MVSRITLKFCVIVLSIGSSIGVSDYQNAFSTLTSNVDTFCPMPQWDTISGTDLTGPSPQLDLYDSLADDGGSRGKRSLSMYYPPMVLPPSTLSTWHQCPVPQILTIDSSIMAKPLACKTETLPMCVQMMEIPGTVGNPVCGPVTYEPDFSVEVMQPMMAPGKSAACTAATSEEDLPCKEVATEAPEKSQKEKSETPEESSPVAGLLSKVFTPSALAELSKFEEKTEKSEGSNVKRQTLPELPLKDALPLPDDVKVPSMDDLKAKLLKDALADPTSALSSLLPVLTLLGNAAKLAPATNPPPCSCLPVPPCTPTCSSGCSASLPLPPVPSPSDSGSNGLLGLDPNVLGPKGLLNLDANVLNLLGLDAGVLEPKGLLNLDANIPNLPSPPNPVDPSSKTPSGSGGLIDLNANVLGPKGLLDLDANVLKLLGLDLSLLGPKGLLNLDANLPSSPPPSPPPATPPAPAPAKPAAHNGGLLNLDANLLGPKGVLDLNANILKLLGLDLNLLGPKGVLNLDANLPNSSPPAAPPAPASPSPPKPAPGNGGLLGLDASVLGPKGLLDLDANVLNLLGLDLNLLGPKGLLSLDANIPNAPSPSGSSPPGSPLPPKLPLDPLLLKLLLKALGPKVVLALLSKALSPAVLLALLKSASKPASKPCPPAKCCPRPPSPCAASGVCDLDASLMNEVLGDEALLDLDLALLPPPTLEIPSSSIYEIYGNSYSPIMPLCTKTCTMPVCASVRSASSCSTPLRPVNALRTFGPLAKLLKAPDATGAPPADALSQIPSVPNTTDALPQVPPTLNSSDAIPPASSNVNPTDVQPPALPLPKSTEDVPNPVEDASLLSGQQESEPLSTILSPMKSLLKSGDRYSLAKSLSRLISIPPIIEEPVEQSVSTITESVPTTVPPPARDITGTTESARDSALSTEESTDMPGFIPPLEPDAEFIDPTASMNLPHKMNLISDSDSSCRRRFLETISQPVIKHFTYQLDLPH